jgi:hypothetical protein
MRYWRRLGYVFKEALWTKKEPWVPQYKYLPRLVTLMGWKRLFYQE